VSDAFIDLASISLSNISNSSSFSLRLITCVGFGAR
jgi:hypothetical protein